MKREGRQHGLVRTCPVIVLPPSDSLLNHPRPPPRPKHIYSSCTAGPFARVSSKPTNHSKFTGKCGRAQCPDCQKVGSAAGKAKGNKKAAAAKGTLKQRTADAAADNKSIAWRVDAAPSNNYRSRHDDVPGLSATGILGYLAGLDYTDDLDDEE
ncbi:unnamed protein product [Cuscuta campestris]|uniref:Uncharacterized protein n=2 Tax=Cuscuta sect. Cleistogrammica TaxID=1824901 RepID=A0A484N6D5_9ASTE|nr:hypothetical protein DM860_005188 [Cuscuta australis]VFQ96851.1 unnamed protein product [Cuscuta campestris]